MDHRRIISQAESTHSVPTLQVADVRGFSGARGSKRAASLPFVIGLPEGRIIGKVDSQHTKTGHFIH
jgi:hypothetical protein